MNHRALILQAAVDMDEKGKFFTVEDLVVGCWLKHPETFSMHDYPYPNAPAVTSKVYGATGLVHQGHLEFVGTKELRVTAKGKREAKSLPREDEGAEHA
jgi:hypothetical protein